jgi:hypothetical protein
MLIISTYPRENEVTEGSGVVVSTPASCSQFTAILNDVIYGFLQFLKAEIVPQNNPQLFPSIVFLIYPYQTSQSSG